MRKLLLSTIIAAAASGANAQMLVSTFDTLSLSQPDTSYVNFSAPGTDVGFQDGLTYFPCVYDTAWGFEFWSYGFSYSNMTDTATSGISNQYAAKTGSGYNSSQYAVAYGSTNSVIMDSLPLGLSLAGFYITNTTYAYNSMRDGDSFAKKFGGASGNDPDWFKLIVRGYQQGVPTPDSVEFYLADFRDANNVNDSIVNTWRWVDLMPLGIADSLVFSLSSSDTGAFGMNTPAYFAMDNFTLFYNMSVSDTKPFDIKAYPNPATDYLNLEFRNTEERSVRIVDMTGKVVLAAQGSEKAMSVPVAQLPAGTYVLDVHCGNNSGVIRFQKH